jgi:F-type H+-transporting ATPase subunit b
MLALNMTLVVMMFLFLLFAWAMNMVFFRPVSKVLEERQEHIRKQQSLAADALRQARGLELNYENRIEASRQSALETVQKAQATVSAERQTRLEEAKGIGRQRIEQAKTAIAQDYQQAQGTLNEQAQQLQHDIIRKVLNVGVNV